MTQPCSVIFFASSLGLMTAKTSQHQKSTMMRLLSMLLVCLVALHGVKAMNKGELIDAIAKEANLKQVRLLVSIGWRLAVFDLTFFVP